MRNVEFGTRNADSVKQPRIVRRSLHRPGRLVPREASRLRGRVIQLSQGQAVDWHTTGPREEMLVELAGAVQLQWKQDADRLRRLTLRAGHAVFIPSAIRHRVVNPAKATARYFYITA